jgi:hypothetical protein
MEYSIKMDLGIPLFKETSKLTLQNSINMAFFWVCLENGDSETIDESSFSLLKNSRGVPSGNLT